jgi:glycosyltransferase involved in cell wall biosynthesis
MANHFASAGWDVTVVTPQREFFRDYIHSFDPALEETVDPRVRIERVPFSGDLWEPDIRRYSRLRVYAPELWRRRWLRQNTRTFPEMYSPWIQPTVERALALHARDRFDAVIATGNPFASFAIAWEFHQRTQVPYVIDYRDSWTLDMFSETPAFRAQHPAWNWERRIIAEATATLFVNEALRRWHAERYPDLADRFMVVENGWDPDILGEPRPPHPGVGEIRFGYLGTLMRQMPLDEFIAGWRIAREHGSMRHASAHFYGHLGYFPGSSARYLGRIVAGGAIGISYDGPVNKTEVRRVYESTDVLLLIIASSRFVTSGKVYEYIATGRPIVSVHEPYCAASDVLRGYPLWFPAASLVPEHVAAALIAAAAAVTTVTPELTAKARDYAAGLTRDAQLGVVESRLRGALRSAEPASERSPCGRA